MLRIATLVLTLFALLLLAGCGDDESSTVTVTETSSSTSSSTESSTTSAEDPTTTTEDGGTPEATKTVTKLTGFTSPSGNIGCLIDRKSVRCDIAKRDWNPPKAPASCKLDYGQGITLTAGAAPEFVCAGDTALGGGEELAYGESIAAGLLRCESEEAGMTCTDSETGRGFTIAQEAYELF
jgi:hypothetical protein